MPTESDQTLDHQDSKPAAGMGPPLPIDASGSKGSSSCWVICVVVLVVLVYPAAWRLVNWGESTVAKGVPPVQVAQAKVLLNWSLQQAKVGHFKECIEAAEQATILNPRNARAFNNLGFCLANLRRWDDAIRSTQEALSLDPNLQLARNNLAWMQQEKRKSTSVGEGK